MADALRDVYRENHKTRIDAVTLPEFVTLLNRWSNQQALEMIEKTHYFSTRFYRLQKRDGTYIWMDEQDLLLKAQGFTVTDFEKVCKEIHPQIRLCSIPYEVAQEELFMTSADRLMSMSNDKKTRQSEASIASWETKIELVKAQQRLATMVEHHEYMVEALKRRTAEVEEAEERRRAADSTIVKKCRCIGTIMSITSGGAGGAIGVCSHCKRPV